MGIIICKYCSKKFKVIPSREKKAKYCSGFCRVKGVFGEKGYWYGKKRGIEFTKTQSIAQKERFKWDKPWNKGKYKTGKIGYGSLHRWVREKLGTPKKCEHCGMQKEGIYHWANKSGKYLQIIEDWIRLCPKCHVYFDGTYKNLNSYKNL